jgi:hypothetical protein
VVGQLQSSELHPKLAKVFDGGGGGQQQPGGGAQPPPGGGQPPGQQPGGGQAAQGGANALFKDSLTVESRYYALKVVARLQSEEMQAPADDQQQGVQTVLRLVVFRSPTDRVTTLFLGESPE